MAKVALSTDLHVNTKVTTSKPSSNCFPRHQKSLMVSCPSRSLAKCRPPNDRSVVVRSAAAETQQERVREVPAAEVEGAIQLLRSATGNASVPAKEVLQALRVLDRSKPKGIDYSAVVAGKGSQVKLWRLVYTAGAKEIIAASKGQATKGGAYWAILPACIGYSQDGLIHNSVSLGHVARFTFEGYYELSANKIAFDFTRLLVKLGPWTLPFQLKKEEGKTWSSPSKAAGLFVLVYGDEEILAARGRSGGVALWARATPMWEIENGLV